VWGFVSGRELVYFARRVFIAEPFFKAYITERGRGLHTGVFMHWIQGKGEIIVGDDVIFDGKSSITFASRFTDTPRLVVGSRTGISHNCDITIGKLVTIGSDCRIAPGVTIIDSSGHPANARLRIEGAPPADEDVRPVTIGNNVWIGKRAIVLPGVTIGDGCIIAAGSVVMTEIPPYTFAAGNPARRIGSVPHADGEGPLSSRPGPGERGAEPRQ
jgi:acetyltransferase-like isoleucine patch superfamily enzyme